MTSLPDAYTELATTSRAARRRAFEAGVAPAPDELTGWEFEGWNTCWVTSVLRVRKFVKAFFDEGEESYGCNSPAQQNGLGAGWLLKPSDAEPKRFGFYLLEPAHGKRHPNALLLDYGRGRNGFFQPARLLRDYLVRIPDSDDDVLLGKAYLALGPLRVPVSYFVLRRRRELPEPPRLPR